MGTRRKNFNFSKNAMALWLVIILVAVFSLVGTIYFTLSRGLAKQVEFIDASLRAQYIAESVFSELYSKLISTSWENRWFANRPEVKTRQSLYDG